MKPATNQTCVLVSCIVLIFLCIHLFLTPVWYKREVFWNPPKTSSETIKFVEPRQPDARQIDSDLYPHLHEYNPFLPTDYEYHPDPEKPIQKLYFRNVKHTMGAFVYERLHQKKGGFFIECGAYDGLWISNTAWLERVHNWTGLLVEVDPNESSILKKRNRRATVADVCLSTEIYPTQLNFTFLPKGHTFVANDVIKAPMRNEKGISRMVKCFPLHMILDAISVKEVDYFSLDVEGVDLDVLKTIPFHRIKIKLISVETLTTKAANEMQKYLEAVGYRKVKHLKSGTEYMNDDVYELIE